jgi:hypothetical protein
LNRDQDAANPMTSGDLIPSERDKPETASLEVEFALVISRMIDSLKSNPEDMRQAIYELARYKLEEQLPDVTAEEKERTQHALETAIRGVEAFTEQNVGIPTTPPHLQLGGPRTASMADDRFYPELVSQVGASLHLHADVERNAGSSKNTHTPLSYLRRTAALIAILWGRNSNGKLPLKIGSRPSRRATVPLRLPQSPRRCGQRIMVSMPSATMR